LANESQRLSLTPTRGEGWGIGAALGLVPSALRRGAVTILPTIEMPSLSRVLSQ